MVYVLISWITIRITKTDTYPPRRARKAYIEPHIYAVSSSNRSHWMELHVKRRRSDWMNSKGHRRSSKEDDGVDYEGPISPREIRKRRRDQLRSKATGVGVSLSQEEHNTRIVYDDDELVVEPKGEDSRHASVGKQPVDQDSDDDDDNVEEVKDTVARQESIRRQQVYDLARQAAKPKSRKRRKKQVEPMEEDFDEEFFTELDAQAEKAESDNVQSKLTAIPLAKRTTFVVAGGEEAEHSIQTDHNIEVVVLNGPEQTMPYRKSQVSDAAVIYSRGKLLGGSVALSPKQRQNAKKSGRPVMMESLGWKRSRKMNQLLSGSKVRRRKNQGTAATRFLVHP